MGMKNRLPLVLTIAAVLFLALAVYGIFTLRESSRSARQSEAAMTVRELIKAEREYSTSYPGVGYAPDLKSLGPPPSGDCAKGSLATQDHACLIDGVLGCPNPVCQKGGYGYSVIGERAPRELYYSDFVVTAAPIDPTEGRVDYCAAVDEVLRFRKHDDTKPMPDSAMRCMRDFLPQ